MLAIDSVLNDVGVGLQVSLTAARASSAATLHPYRIDSLVGCTPHTTMDHHYIIVTHGPQYIMAIVTDTHGHCRS